MRNPLQEQLLKAGLVKKGKVAEVAREQARARHGKQPAGPSETPQEAERARREKAERDRALSQARNEEARAHERRAQARQLIADGRVAPAGERDYRFQADGAIRTVHVDDAQARALATGVLVIARLDAGYVLLTRALAARVRERDPEAIVVDHGDVDESACSDGAYDDPRFAVPDDLIW